MAQWWVCALSIMGLMFLGLCMGLPVCFAFFLANFIILFIFVGGVNSFFMLAAIGIDNLMSYYLAPIFLFILLGEILLKSGAGKLVVDAVDVWIGRLPGRLSMLAVGAGAVLGALLGSTLPSAAILTGSLGPVMKEKRYSTDMIIGPILIGSMLAVLIPPSNFAVLVGSIAKVSIGYLLLGIVGPGLLLTFVSMLLLGIAAAIKPSIAPPSSMRVPIKQKIVVTLRATPLLGVVFALTGFLFLGIATPTECAGMGALVCFLIALVQRRLNWEGIKAILLDSTKIGSMIMLIVMSAAVFSSIIAYTGGAAGIAKIVVGLGVSRITAVILMLLVVVLLGMITEITSIAMITIPIYMPVVKALDIDPLWFNTLMVTCLTIGSISPPFGLLLFTVAGYMPETPLATIYRIAIPWNIVFLFVIAICIAFPSIITWLPSMMR